MIDQSTNQPLQFLSSTGPLPLNFFIASLKLGPVMGNVSVVVVVNFSLGLFVVFFLCWLRENTASIEERDYPQAWKRKRDCWNRRKVGVLRKNEEIAKGEFVQSQIIKRGATVVTSSDRILFPTPFSFKYFPGRMLVYKMVLKASSGDVRKV